MMTIAKLRITVGVSDESDIGSRRLQGPPERESHGVQAENADLVGSGAADHRDHSR